MRNFKTTKYRSFMSYAKNGIVECIIKILKRVIPCSNDIHILFIILKIYKISSNRLDLPKIESK